MALTMFTVSLVRWEKMQERINEILALIDEQLSLVADNYIESSYKARTLASYVQALNGLLTAQKSYKEESIGE
jgi:hypothetical protein|nr:MAG: hypothetical protein [Bacteriophage sp.]UVX77705.1 MAG: hypothetical protein [Bacteriophage sp.]UVY12640.1 MAG: hypothetical protein [Bacteriophage sp.]UVY39610.1 MAG: hypothetical protein [Bacteriophage sp.]